MSSNLIIYYSRKGENYVNGSIVDLKKGNTEICAEFIQKAVGGDLFEVETVHEYAKEYRKCAEEASKELKENARPELKKYLEDISAIQAAESAKGAGAVAMHDVAEGGIFGALWDMAEASKCGMDIDLKKIPVKQETIEICEFFDINPYKLISQGCLIIAAFDGSRIVREINRSGTNAVIIGTATESNDRVLISGEEKRFLETAQTDEIYKIFK